MAVTVSDASVARLEEAQTTMLSLLRSDSVNGWCADHEQLDAALAGVRYRIRGHYLDAGVFTRRETVVVTVERITPELPAARELQRRFGLTRREAEVALQLARGASNEAAGQVLGISPHTVRSHAERIFSKLGIHTRKALALRLLE